ncbi:MAG: metalloregulator ArsR/SmtB family transcription factor [Candidatus Acetothermia bacterium]|jgi:ArsR family transcriptional regulator|nr:metalloregulator ArsR/SmtB family transcription factor [Candidatus Acetothermia bacterium]MDH7505784.1 metalloregulator ArsR/SmtB family transcription factor [Candidatus Acetothermia bacterium]
MYERYADLFKCFAQQSRLRLIKLLASAEELSVTELGEALGVKHSTVSKHLNLLRLQGLVKFRREGQLTYYSLNLERIAEFLEEFLEFLQVADEELALSLPPRSALSS